VSFFSFLQSANNMAVTRACEEGVTLSSHSCNYPKMMQDNWAEQSMQVFVRQI
jgi:hypothetical protein